MSEPKIAACVRVLIGEAMHSAKLTGIINEFGLPRLLKFLANYLQRKMDEGIVRQTDPFAAALSFIGPLFSYAVVWSILKLPNDPVVDTESFLTSIVDNFMRGLVRT